ncbi:MAG: hypothetical protein KUG75_01785 [Pseudomonadales bacterium]|nr:hypothetical protein [Pseudomonadales bacterium]
MRNWMYGMKRGVSMLVLCILAVPAITAGSEGTQGGKMVSGMARQVENFTQTGVVASAMPSSGQHQDSEARASKAGFAHRADMTQTRVLDPAIFTLIRPFTLDRQPVKLPEDQVLK